MVLPLFVETRVARRRIVRSERVTIFATPWDVGTLLRGGIGTVFVSLAATNG